MPKNKESEFEKLARLIKEEGEDIRTDVRDQIGGLRSEVHDQIGGLRKEMHEGFAAISRRLDQIIHATRRTRGADQEAGNRCLLQIIFAFRLQPRSRRHSNSSRRGFPSPVTRRHTPFRSHANHI